MPPKLYIELGRTGDIVNILPLMLREHSHDNIFRLMVAKEYWPLLQGCSYVKPVIYHGEHNQPGLAEAWAKIHKPGEDPVVCQVENNPHDTRRVTDSYQKESWRLAGALEEFGRWPLVFDQRKAARESELVGRYRREKPLILFGGESLSSPFGDRDRLLATLRSEFMDYDVIDLATIKLPHIFDLLGLYRGSAMDIHAFGGVPSSVDMILLFRRPILDYWCETSEDLSSLVKHVLIHEIGHHFGLSDDDMDRIEDEA